MPDDTKPLPDSMLLSLDDVKIPIHKMKLKIAVLKWHLGLPGANELIDVDPKDFAIWVSNTVKLVNHMFRIYMEL